MPSPLTGLCSRHAGRLGRFVVRALMPAARTLSVVLWLAPRNDVDIDAPRMKPDALAPAATSGSREATDDEPAPSEPGDEPAHVRHGTMLPIQSSGLGPWLSFLHGVLPYTSWCHDAVANVCETCKNTFSPDHRWVSPSTNRPSRAVCRLRREAWQEQGRTTILSRAPLYICGRRGGGGAR